MKSFRSGIGNYDANAHVYHYTSAETALRHILPAGKLRIGPLTTVNDPRESRMLGFTYLPKGMLRASLLSGESLEFHIKNLDKRDITDRASAPLTAQIKVVCFARDTASPATTVQGYYRGYTRPSMWAHYGGSHTGICLVFDRDQLVADAHRDLGALGHLAYGNMRYPANRIALRDQLAMNLDLDEISRVGLEQSLAWKFRDYHAELCLKKHPDWRMEEE